MATDRKQVYQELNTAGSHGTNASLATAQSIAVPAGATLVALQARAQAVTVTFDGTTPVKGASSVGFLLAADGPAEVWPVAEGMTVKAIEEASTARLQYQFFKDKA